MRPFDLPPGNPADWLYADLCRPAEVREAYLSMPPDDHDHANPDVPEQPTRPVLPFPPALFVPVQNWTDDSHSMLLHHAARELRRNFYATAAPSFTEPLGPLNP